jgi:uncharacterized iron-regulated membrane protein
MKRPVLIQKRKPLLPPSWFSAGLPAILHFGLALAGFIYLVCLSGTLAVFAQELQRWEQPAGPVVQSVSPAAVDNGFNAIRAKVPRLAKDSVTIALPTPAIPRLTLSAGGHEGAGGEIWLADATGRPVVKAYRPTTDFIVALHTGLHLPEGIGRTLVGLIGIALLGLLISGVLAHPRIFKDAFSFRRGGSRRLQTADLHNRLGTWGLPFFLTVTLTGTILGVFFVIFAGLAATAYKGDFGRLQRYGVRRRTGAPDGRPCFSNSAHARAGQRKVAGRLDTGCQYRTCRHQSPEDRGDDP